MKKRKPPVGVIGLGIMGGAMAEALLSAGHEVLGYDPAPATRARGRACARIEPRGGCARPHSCHLLAFVRSPRLNAPTGPAGASFAQFRKNPRGDEHAAD